MWRIWELLCSTLCRPECFRLFSYKPLGCLFSENRVIWWPKQRWMSGFRRVHTISKRSWEAAPTDFQKFGQKQWRLATFGLSFLLHYKLQCKECFTPDYEHQGTVYVTAHPVLIVVHISKEIFLFLCSVRTHRCHRDPAEPGRAGNGYQQRGRSEDPSQVWMSLRSSFSHMNFFFLCTSFESYGC